MRKFGILFASLLVIGMGSLSQQNAIGQYAGTKKVPESVEKGFQTIDEATSKKWLAVLAGDSFKGRGTGQIGYIKAAHFVAGKLAEFGFQPVGDNGTYFQNIEFTKSFADINESVLSCGEFRTKPGELSFSRFGGGGAFDGKICFLKLADNQKKVDVTAVKGRIVILKSNRFDRRLRNQFRRAGAVAVFRVAEKTPKNESRVAEGNRAPAGTSVIDGHIAMDAALRLAKASKLAPQFLKGEKINKTSLVTRDNECRIVVRLRSQSIMVPNVVGWLPGSDPELRHEHVAIGAHLDHLGESGGNVFPGADDNGSGTTALLQVAKALNAGKRPKRSIFYIAFAGEERGLIGSRYYVNNPIFPLKDCVCLLNIDMIGRNEEGNGETAAENEQTMHLVGSQVISNELHQLALKANEYVGFTFEYDQEGVYHRSDHYNFAKHGIPITFIFGGFHPHYHRPSDGLKGINFSKIANGARLNYLMAMMAAKKGHFKKDGKQYQKKKVKK